MRDESNNFWFALAKAQWDCKALDIKVHEKVREIISSGLDLEIWRDLGCSEDAIKKRGKVLDRFLGQLQSERPKAKSRKKRRLLQPIFAKGDCLTFRLANGNYGGAVILEAEPDTEQGSNLVAVTRINQPRKPQISEFENAEILLLNFANWDGKEQIIWIFRYRVKEVEELFEVVGSINIRDDFLTQERQYRYGFTSGWKMAVIDAVNSQFTSEKAKPKPTKKLTVNDFAKPRRRFWK
jgi:hypothetical protein